ncbi:MAG: hypothetical protein ABSE16_04100 [Verrucomicrobiota bacterium]
MNDNVRQMMGARIQAVQLAIEHVGPPSDGMPVAGVTGLKTPNQTRNAPARVNAIVFGYVIQVVVIEEVKTGRRRIEGYSAQAQGKANESEFRIGIDISHLIVCPQPAWAFL